MVLGMYSLLPFTLISDWKDIVCAPEFDMLPSQKITMERGLWTLLCNLMLHSLWVQVITVL